MISVRKRIQFTCRRVFTILVGAICTFLISICSVSSDAKEPEISEQDLFFGFYHMLVSLHVVYEAPMGALGIGSVATGAQGPHGLA